MFIFSKMQIKLNNTNLMRVTLILTLSYPILSHPIPSHPIPIPILISRNIYQFFGLLRDDEQPDSDSDEDDAEDEDVRHHVLGVEKRVDGRQLLTHQGST